MNDTQTIDRLLEEIDSQQTELLWRLDELNARVERTLREQLTSSVEVS
jgi:hypothetical protein